MTRSSNDIHLRHGDLVLWYAPSWWRRIVTWWTGRSEWTHAGMCIGGGLVATLIGPGTGVMPLACLRSRPAVVWRYRRWDDEDRALAAVHILRQARCPRSTCPWHSSAHLLAHVWSVLLETAQPFGTLPAATTAQQIARHCADHEDWHQVMIGVVDVD